MKFSRRKAVSPIIASLLLIAIAVAAGIIVYVYVNSLAGGLTSGGGNQVSQQIQLQSYSFNAVGANGFTSSGTSGSGQAVDVFLENTGGSAIVINAVYFDGVQLTEWTNTAGSYSGANLEVPGAGTSDGCYALLTTSTTAIAVTTSTTSTAVVGTGTSTGPCTGTPGTCVETNAFCIKTSASTETSSLAAQGTDQLIIGLSHAFPVVTQGTSHTIKLITATGGQAVFTVVVGRSG